jgi:hypothetical protein
MYAAISRNDGWQFEMVNPHNGADGHRYRYTSYGRHTGTIQVTAEGFRWETASHLDGSPLASGTTTAIAEAFRAVTSGEPAAARTGTWARAAAAAGPSSTTEQAAPGPDGKRAAERALDGVYMSTADGENREARLDPFGSYSCGFCSGVTVSPEGWAETQRADAEHYARDGETFEPRPYPEYQRRTWEAKACGNPACLTNLNASQLAVTRQRIAGRQADAERRERQQQAWQQERAERQQREAELWAEAAAEAKRRGACIQCLRKSGWRSGRPKYVRHRSEDYHGPATTTTTAAAAQ